MKIKTLPWLRISNIYEYKPHSTSISYPNYPYPTPEQYSRRPTERTAIVWLPIILCGAIMATFTPRPPTSRPITSEFPPSSPPDRSYYNMHNGAPQTATLNQPANGSRVQHRLSTDFESIGHAPGVAHGNAGMPVPNGLQHHASGGGSRHRGTVSMGAFDGPRSPPNTKSMPHKR